MLARLTPKKKQFPLPATPEVPTTRPALEHSRRRLAEVERRNADMLAEIDAQMAPWLLEEDRRRSSPRMRPTG